MDHVRVRGREEMQMAPELEDALNRLWDACSARGKSFPKMRAYADRIARGECGNLEAIQIVAKLLEPAEGRRLVLTVEEAQAALEASAAARRAELEELGKRAREVELEERKARAGAIALGKVIEGKGLGQNALRSGRPHKKYPCEWPGCDQDQAPQGRRKHIEKHERDTGMTLEQALGNVTPIRGGSAG